MNQNDNNDSSLILLPTVGAAAKNIGKALLISLIFPKTDFCVAFLFFFFLHRRGTEAVLGAVWDLPALSKVPFSPQQVGEL